MEKQFTATVYILQEEKVLLHIHLKMKKWLPFGGHLEAGETPHEAAIREAKEESGLDVELFLQENVFVKEPSVKSLPRPYLCLLEEIPPFKEQAAHHHIDFIYLGRPLGGKLLEDSNIRWFTLEEVEALATGTEILADTKQCLRHILSEELVLF